MVTTRPMIRLSGFSRKTSFDGPSLNSSGCSSLNPPTRGSQQHLLKCDCDWGDANTAVRKQLAHQQHKQHLLQRHHHQQQVLQQHRNHHLLLLQLQAQKNRKVLKQHPHQKPPPPPPQIQLQQQQKRPVFFPHPPPIFRPTISDSNSESDREGLEHFHKHLQKLHRLTCVSLENAIYFGGGGGATGSHDSKPQVASKPNNKLKSHKSFSFRDIRDIGKKKRSPTNVASKIQHQNLQPSSLTIAASSSTSPPSSSSTQTSSSALKRRNTTRTAKDYIGAKLLAKYWNKGKSSAADSGNGGSCGSSSSNSSSNVSRSSDSGDSQLSNYSSVGGTRVPSPKNKPRISDRANSPVSTNNCVISPRVSHKIYPISQNDTSGGSSSAVTYKVRYDIPSSWESEQLLSFASAGSSTDHHQYTKHDIRKHQKGASSSSRTSSTTSEDQLDHIVHEKKVAKTCTQCGRGPDAHSAEIAGSSSANKSPTTVSLPKPRKSHIFKALTFTKSQNQKPKAYATNPEDNVRKGKADNKKERSPCCENKPTLGSVQPSSIPVLTCSGNNNNSSRTMVQHKLSALGRSKSQKCPDRRPFQSPYETSAGCKLTHVHSTASIANHAQHPPKVRFKEQHHRSEQYLNDKSNHEVRRNVDRTNLLSKWGRRSSSSSTTIPTPSTSASPNNSKSMLPDEREYHSLFDCRIPRPKLKGIIVPTHSYGVGGSGSVGSGLSSPVSRCSSAIGENNGRTRRFAAGDFLDFTEISLQDDDSETSGFESEQNNTATTTTMTNKDDSGEGDVGMRRKQQVQRNVPADMTPAGKYFTDFKTLYHYQDQRLSIQKSPTPSRGLSFRKPNIPFLSRSGKKKGFEDSTAEFLKSLPIFRKLNDGFFAKLSDHIAEVYYDNGKYIFRQGEKGDSMYFLITGSAKATFKSLEAGKSEDIFLKTLHPGDFFGEKAFQMKNSQYTCNVIVSSEDGATCVKLDREAYEELVYKCHDFKIRAMDRSQRKNKLPEEIAKIKLDDLRIVTTLGVGGFGRVELCTLAKDSSRAFALKKMKKCQIVATRQIEHIRSEKSILLETNCDFICKLYKTFKDTKYLYMLMECCLGGELWTVLRDRGRFEDDTAKFYIGCVIEALKYLHMRNIIYRDLKPENLLLDSTGYVKLVDFGFAKKLDGRKTWTFCGTPEYCAPEIILNKGHDLSADFWSLGVLMYELLTGTPPFTGGDPLRTYKIILQGIDAIDVPPTVSKYALNLIRKLCRDNPADRLGAQRGRISDIKKHKWFDGFEWYGLQTRTLTPPIIPDVRGPLDFGNFDEYPPDRSGSPPDDKSGWDWDF